MALAHFVANGALQDALRNTALVVLLNARGADTRVAQPLFHLVLTKKLLVLLVYLSATIKMEDKLT